MWGIPAPTEFNPWLQPLWWIADASNSYRCNYCTLWPNKLAENIVWCVCVQLSGTRGRRHWQWLTSEAATLTCCVWRRVTWPSRFIFHLASNLSAHKHWPLLTSSTCHCWNYVVGLAESSCYRNFSFHLVPWWIYSEWVHLYRKRGVSPPSLPAETSILSTCLCKRCSSYRKSRIDHWIYHWFEILLNCLLKIIIIICKSLKHVCCCL